MHLCMVVEHKRCRSSTHLRRRQGRRTRPGHHRRLEPTVELLAHLCSSAAAVLRPAVRLVWKLELKDQFADDSAAVSTREKVSRTRRGTARATQLVASTSTPAAIQEVVLGGIFLVLRDPV